MCGYNPSASNDSAETVFLVITLFVNWLSARKTLTVRSSCEVRPLLPKTTRVDWLSARNTGTDRSNCEVRLLLTEMAVSFLQSVC